MENLHLNMVKMKNKIKKISLFFISMVFLVLTLSFASISALTISDVSTNPLTVAPGESLILIIELENNLENDAKNVNIELDLTNIPIAPFESSSEQSLDEIQENDEEKLQFKLIADPKASSGIYKIPVKISYLLKDQRQEKTGVVSIIVNSEPKITITGDGYLIQGTEQEISIKIINDELSDVKFLSVQIGNSNKYQINSPLYEYIGNLDSDDEDSIEYKIHTISTDKTVSIPVTIKYKDSTNKDYTKTETLTFPIYTKKEAQNKGLIDKPNYILYGIIILIILIFIFYRIVKRRRR